MFSQPCLITFQIPGWVNRYCQRYETVSELKKRMDFVISASRINVEEGTGGPFAAAIFEIDSGKLVSLGVNLVTTQNLSILHAEMVAISIAQSKLKTYDLVGRPGLPKHELMISSEPCAMCFGAIPWSGVQRVVIAAKGDDVRNIGFDEGSKPENWSEALMERGVQVIDNIERESARAVLNYYRSSNGHIYNSRES